jgi:hypothetical protein
MTARKHTILMLEMMDEGILDAKFVAEMCLNYMSERDVEDMMADNELLPEEEDENDGQPSEHDEWMSFDPEC